MPALIRKKVYIKDNSRDPIFKETNIRFYFKSRILSGLLMAVGFLILTTQVVLPLVFFKTQDKISTPFRDSVLGVATGFSDFKYNELAKEEESADTQKEQAPKYFTLSIPRLHIDQAIVETSSSNLNPDAYLGHYNGSALPGNSGNAFIYGHSVLPWFFNPKNYRTIFSTLGDLQTGDEIQINFNGKKLTYKVESKEVVAPNYVNPLGEFKPAYLKESTITLMTCWPAGTKAKRLMVKAVLVN